MENIRFMRAAQLRHSFENGLSRQPMLPEANAEAKIFDCVLKAGHTWQPPLYSRNEKLQIFFFKQGAGYLTTQTQCWQIDRQCIFVPDFAAQAVTITAGEEDLCFYHITARLNDYDRATMDNFCIKLPRFRTYDDCVEYTEGFTGDAGSNIRSHLLIEGRACGRWSMGWNDGVGPNFIGQHIHPFLEQWYIVLPDGSFTYLADGQEVPLGPGDMSYTHENTYHGSSSQPGQKINYIWLELATNGYPLGPDGLPGLADDYKPQK